MTMRQRLSKTASLLLSPIMLPLFLLAPALFLFLRLVQWELPSIWWLMGSNLLLALYISARLIAMLSRAARGSARYGETPPARGYPERLSESEASALREAVAREGYVSYAGGTYLESREPGFRASLLMHAALALCIMLGTYDYMRQYSGTLLIGVGKPAELWDERYYTASVVGPMTELEGIDLSVQVVRQWLPGREWPRGASMVRLAGRDGREIYNGVLAPGMAPVRAGDLEVFMERSVYSAWIAITTIKESLITYTGWISLFPSFSPEGPYTHTGSNESDGVKAEAWLDPEATLIRARFTKDGKPLINDEVVLGMEEKSKVDVEGFHVVLNGLGRWSDLRMVRKRHLSLIISLAALSALAGVLRLLSWPRRLWLRPLENGGVEAIYEGRGTLEALRRNHKEDRQ